MLVRDEPLLVELAEIAFPLLLGVLVAGYGSWLRHEGLSGNQLGTIAIGSVLGGAAFAFFTGWLLTWPPSKS